MLTVIKTMRDKVHKCADNITEMGPEITTIEDLHIDGLIYNYAVKLCQQASIDELIGEREKVSPVVVEVESKRF